MKLKFLLSLVYVMVIFIVVSCDDKNDLYKDKTSSDNQAVEEIYFDNLMEFHIDHQARNAVFVLTAYERPYYGHFAYIFLTQSNEIWLALDYSSTHIVGGRHGKITASEKENILNVLSTLARTSNKIIPEDKNLITISYNAENLIGVFSCQESNCPTGLCAIYEIANEVVKRNSDTNPVQYKCPIP